MPCLNEAETLESCIQKAQACLSRLGIDGEVLVADNGSTDGSQALALRLGARVVDVAPRGYGAALYAGSLAARGRAIIMGDADGSYDFSRLDAFVAALRDGVDLVMGNRFAGGIRPGAMPWKNRYLGNPLLSAIGRLFFRAPVRDFHCGLRGFTQDAFRRMNLQTTGMEFASEMVIKATLLALRIVEVPTTLDPDGRSRPPHLRPWRDGWRHLRFMLLFCPRWLFLYPGLALIGAGTLGTVLVLAGAVPGLQRGLAPHALLLASVAVLLGFQAVAFAFCARIYAFTEGLRAHDPRLERLFTRFTLETGLLAGTGLLLAGIAGGALGVVGWSPAGLWTLEPARTILIGIAAAVATCLGGQLMLISFLLSVFGLGRRSSTRL